MSTKKYKKTCQICGKSFNAKRIDAKYCSNLCAKKHSICAILDKKIAQKEEEERIRQDRIEKERTEKQKEKEFEKFKQEYERFERRENEKKYVRDKISMIILSLKDNATIREKRNNIITERKMNCCKAFKKITDSIENNVPIRYKKFMRINFNVILQNVSNQIEKDLSLNNIFCEIDDIDDDGTMKHFVWFSFFPKIDNENTTMNYTLAHIVDGLFLEMKH